ncbi:MAG TPA: cupin domain-containing protein [Terriglobales bacterium]|nr:cupin domain-containing protein [Terriglobales bacterium]
MASQPPNEPPPRPVGHEQMEGVLDRPILRFGLGAEVDHLHRQEAWRTGTGPSSTTLVKHPDLRVVLVTMRAGEVMPEHRTVARITVHALTGTLRLHLAGKVEALAAGELLVLDRDLVHSVEAVEDCAFLLTLAWPVEGAA